MREIANSLPPHHLRIAALGLALAACQTGDDVSTASESTQLRSAGSWVSSRELIAADRCRRASRRRASARAWGCDLSKAYIDINTNYN